MRALLPPGFKPRKTLGQNFLAESATARRIVEALDPSPEDVVVEVGPGLGALTGPLLERAGLVVAIEIDPRLVKALAEHFPGMPRLRLIQADVLKVDLSALAGEEGVSRVKVVGNIPYRITSPLLFHLLAHCRVVSLSVLTLQAEVAERILSPPGSKDYGALSVAVQYRTGVERLFRVGREAFIPRPGVDSTVVKLTPRIPPFQRARDEALLEILVRTTFSQRRKQLQKILRAHRRFGLGLEAVKRVAVRAGIDLSRRPEELTVEEFVRLSDAVTSIREGS